MIGIYRIINKINKDSYIGQSTDIQYRWKAHKYKPFDKNCPEYNCVFYRAIRKYGLENFEFVVLEECSVNDLNEKEKYWINYYRTYIYFNDSKGYNMTLGGDAPSINSCVLTRQMVEEICDLLINSTMMQYEIANIYGVADSTISQINKGKQWVNDKYNYPLRDNSSKYKCIDCGKIIDSQATRCRQCANLFRKKQYIESLPITKDELQKLLLDNNGNFTKVGKQFGITDNGLRKWCKAFDLPTHSINYKTAKINKSSIIKKHKVIMLDKDTEEELKEFNNANEAARFLGKEKGTHIRDVCLGKRKTAYGYKWKEK